MISRWLQRNRGWGSRRRRNVLLDVLVDENGDALVDETPRYLDAAEPATTRGLIDERGLNLIDEDELALIAP